MIYYGEYSPLNFITEASHDYFDSGRRVFPGLWFSFSCFSRYDHKNGGMVEPDDQPDGRFCHRPEKAGGHIPGSGWAFYTRNGIFEVVLFR